MFGIWQSWCYVMQSSHRSNYALEKIGKTCTLYYNKLLTLRICLFVWGILFCIAYTHLSTLEFYTYSQPWKGNDEPNGMNIYVKNIYIH